MGDISFYVNSILLGIGLAMDAFSLSIANGIADTKMKKGRMIIISSTFSIFQFLMPLLGYIFVHTLITYFVAFQKIVPWISLILLSYIGGKMIRDGIKGEEETGISELTPKLLFLQGIATSIDALSVGFTISDYSYLEAIICSLIIGIVTYGICRIGVMIGKTVGSNFEGKAQIIGGIILIIVGLEIFLKGVIIG